MNRGYGYQVLAESARQRVDRKPSFLFIKYLAVCSYVTPFSYIVPKMKRAYIHAAIPLPSRQDVGLGPQGYHSPFLQIKLQQSYEVVVCLCCDILYYVESSNTTMHQVMIVRSPNCMP